LLKCCKYEDPERDEMRFGQRNASGLRDEVGGDWGDWGDIAYAILRIVLHCIDRNILS
jgi:hypothetical protein